MPLPTVKKLKHVETIETFAAGGVTFRLPTDESGLGYLWSEESASGIRVKASELIALGAALSKEEEQ